MPKKNVKPRSSGTRKSPSTASRRKSPSTSTASRRKSPSTVSRRKSPSTASRRKSPSTSTASRRKSPSTASRRKSSIPITYASNFQIPIYTPPIFTSTSYIPQPQISLPIPKYSPIPLPSAIQKQSIYAPPALVSPLVSPAPVSPLVSSAPVPVSSVAPPVSSSTTIPKFIESLRNCEKKEFLILHFLDDKAGESPLTIKKEMCQSHLPIDYNEIYIPVKGSEYDEKKYKLLQELIEKSSAFCSGLLIKLPAIDKLPQEFFPFLKGLTNIPTYSKIYVDNHEKEYIASIEEKLQNPKFQIYLLEKEKKYTKKNVDYTVYRWKGFANVSIMNIFEGNNIITQLECTPWFEHFIERSFNCVFGRLQQISGTCYLNAVLNALFLSPTMRLLMKEKYNQLKDTVDLSNVTKFDDLACPMPQTKSSLPFLLTLTKLLLIDKKKATTKGVDLIKEASQHNYSMVGKEGGSSLKAIIKILESLGLTCAVGYRFENWDYKEGDLSVYFNTVRIGSDRQIIWSEHFTLDKTDFLIISISEPTDVINSNRLYYHSGEPYILLFGLFGVDFKKDAGHAMIGIFCDGRPQIYDSNNYIYDYNWLKHDIPKFQRLYGEEIEKLQIQYVFMRKSLADKLHSNNV